MAIAAVAATLPSAAASGDAQRLVPLERWDVDHFVSSDEKSSSRLETRFGGFVAGAELFDAVAFNVSRSMIDLDHFIPLCFLESLLRLEAAQ